MLSATTKESLMEERIRFNIEVNADISFDAEDVVSQLPPVKVLDLIKELEEEVGLWPLAILLHRHFAEQFDIISKEDPVIATASDEYLLEVLKEHDEE